MTAKDPIRPTDDEARASARALWLGCDTAALAVTDPATGTPMIARVGFGVTGGAGLLLVSDLAQHTSALRERRDCALLLGEPGPKGDPLNSPRLSVRARAIFLAPDDPARAACRQAWLATHPKAKLYVDFADFHFVRLDVAEAFLNGGFGRAYRLAPADLTAD